ncbi:disease resistance protein RGA2-like [Citrus clementina]|uniref:disease resistance protein RGA2-like n=1 Tax=Citrus clementina TaxID=85681 RepID=UPI000CED4455|nr:disease resistance protein RGA2-like [Citrus x clementina]XP_024040913.1 disease resistance protein RGA2-like [Citrus x clementina]XP_024040914.1 disease resistance protein RGA2-like [Citrus x clementina]
MVDAIVSALLEQLISVAADEVKQQVRLVTGVREEVKKLTSNLRAIRAVLEDAEKRQMQRNNAVTFWLDQLKDASYDMEDVLEEWTTARLTLQIEGVDDDTALALAPHKKKVRSFFCAASNCFGSFKQLSLRHDIAVKIREINGKLDDIASQKDTFKFVENVSNNVREPELVGTTSFIDEGKVCGRVDEKNELLSKLLCESSEQQEGLHVISLVGLGGIGKTTLAQLAYNNDEVKRNFEKVIWVCVSDTFEEIRVAKAIIGGLGESTSSLSEFQSLMSHIHRSIEGKKFFLVLDDVWDGNYNKWEPFFLCLKNGHHRSKILVTTRNESVARMMRSTNIISIKQLAEEECWSLFEQLAFFSRSLEDREKLEPMGRKIAHKCKGLPLAAKVIGNLLCSKSTEKEWQSILESEMWKVEEIGQGLLAPLLLSYNDLPSNSVVKRCFSYCAVFPKDYNMDKEELINLWMAQGYLNAEEDEEMEMIGEKCFNILAARSFFQEFQKNDDDDILRCKMHDIVHDFAQFISRKECLWLEINGTKETVINSFGDKVRHLRLKFQGGASFPMSFFEFDRLRTLLIYDESLSNTSLFDDESPSNPSLNSSILRKLFSKLACLRALVIRQLSPPFCPNHPNLIREIPENVGKLIHLKYLNLSRLCIKRLPETLCELYNLQKLDIRRCRNLRELPAGIGKLMNMRSLLNDKTRSLKYMPVGISKLTSLRTLGKFVVGGGVDGSNTCRLESLKNLQLLRECGIEGLGNVSHLDEAERLGLHNMENLLRLRLVFDGVVDLVFDGVVDGEDEERRRRNEKDKQLLEALQPPLSVEKLWIVSYGGNILPKWLTLLTNLRDLSLSSCVNCEHLPPLGKLPLEKLTINNLKSVKRVGNEFLGIEESSEDDPSSSSSSSSVIAFPKLKSLNIEEFDEVEEWNYRITRTENISIMPRLSSLTISSCNKLKALPDYILQTTALQELSIYFCDLLEELPILEDHRTTAIPRLSSLEISCCPKLKVLPDYLLRTTTLQKLTIWGCPLLENRYREGKGEDWHKISHIPHIKWSLLPPGFEEMSELH